MVSVKKGHNQHYPFSHAQLLYNKKVEIATVFSKKTEISEDFLTFIYYNNSAEFNGHSLCIFTTKMSTDSADTQKILSYICTTVVAEHIIRRNAVATIGAYSHNS